MNLVLPIFLTLCAGVGEVFFLRALLKNRSARSFEDLLCVDGESYKTFEDAAFAAHLFEGANAYEETMREAVARLGESQFSPGQLRLLFVQRLLDGASSPKIFLDKFAVHLALDFRTLAQKMPVLNAHCYLQNITLCSATSFVFSKQVLQIFPALKTLNPTFKYFYCTNCRLCWLPKIEHWRASDYPNSLLLRMQKSRNSCRS